MNSRNNEFSRIQKFTPRTQNQRDSFNTCKIGAVVKINKKSSPLATRIVSPTCVVDDADFTLKISIFGKR